MPFGLWTVCLHPNSMNDEAFNRFERDVQAYSDRIMAFSDVALVRRNRGFIDRVAHAFYWMRRGQYKTGLR